MRIVVPKETFPDEKRVMLLPDAVRALTSLGHGVFVQAGASIGLNIPDEHYEKAGAVIVADPAALYAMARPAEGEKGKKGIVVKVKAPEPEEFSMMNDSVLACMLHMEQNRERLYFMGAQGLVGVALEVLRDHKNTRIVDQTRITGKVGVYQALPILMNQSGRMPDEMFAVILGYGNVSSGAIEACSELGVRHKIVRRSEFGKLPFWLEEADLLVNGLTWPGSKRGRQYVVTREDIQGSKPTMVVLDLAVDLPSPIETVTRSTSYLNPYYLEEGRVHISIYGYPGLVPVTSTDIYNRQVLPVVLAIANNGGLKNIRVTGKLGRAIARAVVNPKNKGRYGDWESYKPPVPEASDIE
jgi:alanine dehydrogenase